MAKRILVVDDDRYIVEIYRRTLAKEGYDVVCAYDGKEGIEVLKTIPQPDLVVLDLKMPKITGDEFLKVLRQDTTLKDTKVLVMSSVLYRYKEIPRRGPETQIVVRRDKFKEGLSAMGQKAKDTTPVDERLEMDEKPGRGLEMGFFGVEPEGEAEFEIKVSEDLLERVKGIFGEPYDRFQQRRERKGLGTGMPSSVTMIDHRVIELVAEYFKIDKAKLSHSTDFEKDLGKWYLDCMPLRRKINKEFGVRLSFAEQRDDVKTIRNVITLVEYAKRFDSYNKEKDRKEFWENWKPFVFVWIIFALIGLGMLIWELVIKKYFIN